MKTRHFLKPTVGFLLLIFSLSCKPEYSIAENEMDGVWKSIGYGRIANIEAGEFTLTDVANISCIPLMEGDISDFRDKLKSSK